MTISAPSFSKGFATIAIVMYAIIAIKKNITWAVGDRKNIIWIFYDYGQSIFSEENFELTFIWDIFSVD